MYLSRQVRLVAALIALFSMLFMQLAVAAYACPGRTMAQDDGAVGMSAASADQDMVACEAMDDEQANLCQAYGQADNQSLDQPDVPQVPAYVAIGLAIPLILLDVTYRPAVLPPEAAQLTRTTAPPLSIRNCCFRI